MVKALARNEIYELCNPVVLSDLGVMRLARKITGHDLSFKTIRNLSEGSFKFGTIDIVDYGNVDVNALKFGHIDSSCGRAAVIYTQEAGRMTLEGSVDAMVSAPLNKESMREAGYSYSGQLDMGFHQGCPKKLERFMRY